MFAKLPIPEKLIYQIVFGAVAGAIFGLIGGVMSNTIMVFIKDYIQNKKYSKPQKDAREFIKRIRSTKIRKYDFFQPTVSGDEPLYHCYDFLCKIGNHRFERIKRFLIEKKFIEQVKEKLPGEISEYVPLKYSIVVNYELFEQLTSEEIRMLIEEVNSGIYNKYFY